jgi:hypothetical protein
MGEISRMNRSLLHSAKHWREGWAMAGLPGMPPFETRRPRSD